MYSYKLENKQRMKKQKLTNNIMKVVRCHYFLQKIFTILCKKKSLYIIKYNKQMQNIVNININDYKSYSELYSSIEIEIELAPVKKNKICFFYMQKDKNPEYYHFYLNDNDEEEYKKKSFDLTKIKKYKIIIDYYNIFFNYK